MTIVDVNTGKSVGKTNLEETVVNTNLEAAREVARQLRLRDIGGIIVIDFIDMLLEKNKKQVEDTMSEALAIDKTRSQVFEIGPLGLMQVTRKRVSGVWSNRSPRPAPPAKAGASSSTTKRGLAKGPTMYAVIKTGGKQHKVQAGDVIEVEKLVHEGETVTFHAAPRRRRRRQDPRGRRGRQGDRHREAPGREEGRQGQGLQVPAEDRLRAARRPPSAVTLLRSDVKLGPAKKCREEGREAGRCRGGDRRVAW